MEVLEKVETALEAPDDRRCQAILPDGSQCTAFSLHDDIYCVFHSQKPEHVEKRQEIRDSQPLIGGRCRKYLRNTTIEFERFDSLDDVLDILSENVKNLRSMDATPSNSNAITRCCSVAAGILGENAEIEDLEARIAELENI